MTQKKLSTQIICITGGTGYLGRHLVNALLEARIYDVRVLSRGTKVDSIKSNQLNFINGDLKKIETLDKFLISGCTVINLAYSQEQSKEENILQAKNLASVCKEKKIKRFIHLSTSSVCGAIYKNLITEESFCNPSCDYGRTKLQIEKVLKNGSHQNYDFINLRPTNIFGRDGPGLVKMLRNLKSNLSFVNYLKSCLSFNRKLNLVDIDLVIATIKYFIDQPFVQTGQTYFISQDDEPINNFKEIEKLIMNILGRRYLVQSFPLPRSFLVVLLFLYGRGFVNPYSRYSTEKLRSLHISYSKSFAVGLKQFIRSQILR
jgi:nucleoside-diphosphate-sugar epimerase